jgi:hypothetical protein
MKKVYVKYQQTSMFEPKSRFQYALRMYRAPFHRRILPWIFTIAFIVAAPALVFYTAGYRWNPKKEKIERNGTLIVDSVPQDARLFLNGRDTAETSPITLQNVTPGKYTVSLTLDGYHPWQKRLDVYPEYVTFANNVRLWRDTNPVSFLQEPAMILDASPNGSFFAALSIATSSSRLVIRNSDGSERRAFTFHKPLHPETLITWSADSRGILLESPDATGTTAWVANIRTGIAPMELPRGTYLWDGSSVRGVSEGNRISMSLEDGSFTRQRLADGTRDRYGDIVIRTATGTDSLVLFQENSPLRGLILPPGNWHVAGIAEKHIILRDGSSWMSLNPDEAAPVVHRVSGDRLRPFVTRQKTTYLLVRGGELWMWEPTMDPELLLRQSQPIREAAWDETGRSVIFATDTNIVALDLDPRDGRLQTTLAAFGQTTDFVMNKKRLLIAGERNEQEMIWLLEIE